jgi:hypothetical protein
MGFLTPEKIEVENGLKRKQHTLQRSEHPTK